MSDALKLKWRKTWDDAENDFVAIDRRMKGGTVGRIYLHENGVTKGQWYWSLTADGRGIKRPIGDDRGYAPSARAAAKFVEDAWFASIVGLPSDAPDEAVG